MRQLSSRFQMLRKTFLGSFLSRKQQEDVISLCIGEPFFDTPQHIKERGIQAINKNKTKYTSANGSLATRQAIQSFLSQEYHAFYDLDSIMVSPGAKPLITAALAVLTGDWRYVFIPAPYYPPFYNISVLQSKSLLSCPMLVDTREDDFQITGEAIKRVIGNLYDEESVDSSVLILNSPNNPTGVVYTRKNLESVAKVVKEYDMWVILDESYLDFTYNNDYCFFADLSDMAERTVVIRSFSKTYAMTGWRMGDVLGPPKVVNNINAYMNNCIGCASSISQEAAIAALQSSVMADDVRESFLINRNILLEWLTDNSIPFVEPQGAFYVFPDLSEYCFSGGFKDATEIVGYCLEKARVAITPGLDFGDMYKNFVRISYSVSTDKLKQALVRLEELIN